MSLSRELESELFCGSPPLPAGRSASPPAAGRASIRYLCLGFWIAARIDLDPLDTIRSIRIVSRLFCIMLWWIVSSFTVHLRYDTRTWYIQCTRRYTVQFYRDCTQYTVAQVQTSSPAARTECPPYYACSTSYYFLHNIYNVYVRRS
jgi:hypothetical protein